METSLEHKNVFKKSKPLSNIETYFQHRNIIPTSHSSPGRSQMLKFFDQKRQCQVKLLSNKTKWSIFEHVQDLC